jgi:threonyl-tRNA synthetase
MEIKVNGLLYLVENGQTGFDLLKLVNPENKKDILVYEQNGQKYDLSSPLTSEAPVRFINKDDDEALAILRHDASHLMAQAIQSLYPGAKFGIGPSINEGFYYDVDFGDVTLSEDDLGKIEKRMKEFSKKDYLISHKAVSKDEALAMFSSNEYKVELIKELDGKITVYSQGDFTDLCVGPHMPSTRYVKFFKLLSLAGAYWRGDSNNKQLTRIYGTAFFSEEDLNAYLYQIEEAKKRDHRKLGKELDLFMFSEYGPGFPFWMANGMVV